MGEGAMTERSEVSGILRELSQGRREALDRLVPIVYEELRRIAHAQLRRERPGHTLGTTGLVHEAYLKLTNIHQVEWLGRAHFFATAARVMRRVLIDYARGKRRDKRGGDAVHVPLAEALDVPLAQANDLIDLDDALTRLQAMSERQAQVVECRCFGGLSVDETAAVLAVSAATVKRDWAFARAWLNRELGPAEKAGPPPR
jgi:RNA polymerase sigma factor (TIGR02999 family)